MQTTDASLPQDSLYNGKGQSLSTSPSVAQNTNHNCRQSPSLVAAKNPPPCPNIAPSTPNKPQPRCPVVEKVRHATWGLCVGCSLLAGKVQWAPWTAKEALSSDTQGEELSSCGMVNVPLFRTLTVGAFKAQVLPAMPLASPGEASPPPMKYGASYSCIPVFLLLSR